MNNDKLVIKSKRKKHYSPSEIRIDKDGNVFLDGKLYDENNTQYKGLTLSVEKHKKIETGEETQKMIEQSKTAKKGDNVVITDVKTPNKTQKTTVKF